MRTCTEAQGSGSTALVAAMQLQVTGNARLNRPRDDALYERLCRDIAATGALCNSIASEPEIGSPLARPVLRHHRRVQRRRLSPQWPQDLVDRRPPPVLPAGRGDGLALRAADNHDVYFVDTQIPADNLLDKRDSPYKPLQPLALMAARALLLEVAAEDGRGAFAHIAAAKQYAIEVANEVTDQAIRIAGGAGVTRALPLERYFREVRAGHMQPPNGDAALEAVGQGAISELTQ